MKLFCLQLFFFFYLAFPLLIQYSWIVHDFIFLIHPLKWSQRTVMSKWINYGQLNFERLQNAPSTLFRELRQNSLIHIKWLLSIQTRSVPGIPEWENWKVLISCTAKELNWKSHSQTSFEISTYVLLNYCFTYFLRYLVLHCWVRWLTHFACSSNVGHFVWDFSFSQGFLCLTKMQSTMVTLFPKSTYMILSHSSLSLSKWL